MLYRAVPASCMHQICRRKTQLYIRHMREHFHSAGIEMYSSTAAHRLISPFFRGAIKCIDYIRPREYTDDRDRKMLFMQCFATNARVNMLGLAFVPHVTEMFYVV